MAIQVENAGIGLIDVFLPGLLGFNVIQAGLITAAGAFATYRTYGALRRVQATGIAPGNLVGPMRRSTFCLASSRSG